MIREKILKLRDKILASLPEDIEPPLQDWIKDSNTYLFEWEDSKMTQLFTIEITEKRQGNGLIMVWSFMEEEQVREAGLSFYSKALNEGFIFPLLRKYFSKK